MKTLLNPFTVALALLALGTSVRAADEDVARPRQKALNLPPVWQKVEPEKRLAAVRVAELDATRLLTERIYGVHLDANTIVYDLVLNSDRLAAELSTTMKGVATTEDAVYKDDGTVEVARAVKLRQIIETITENIKQWESKTKLTVEAIRKVEQETKDTVIKVMGNGAIPDSVGLLKIQAKRAAEIDAYRKLTERVMGLQITSKTTVKDFALESDMIRARCAAFIKGAIPIDIAYAEDNSCEAKMQLKVAEVIEIIRHYARNKPEDSELIKMERDYATKTFTETGMGAPRPPTQGSVAAAAVEAGPGAFKEIEVIIKRVVSSSIVVE